MTTITVGKGNRQWEIEFPCECNGRMTESTGFVTPIGDNPENSDFFTYYGEDSTYPIGFASYFPQYVKDAALKLARIVAATR